MQITVAVAIAVANPRAELWLTISSVKYVEWLTPDIRFQTRLRISIRDLVHLCNQDPLGSRSKESVESATTLGRSNSLTRESVENHSPSLLTANLVFL